jgi:hypothetical protein
VADGLCREGWTDKKIFYSREHQAFSWLTAIIEPNKSTANNKIDLNEIDLCQPQIEMSPY